MSSKKIPKEIILVDENDRPVGESTKMGAHENGQLHRAFSVFILDKNNNLLLQQRALSKYHSPGLWSNTCCSHPRPNETTSAAAHRRLGEEMGFDTKLEEIFSFIYKVTFENNLVEYEFDHVFIGYFDGGIRFDPDEVENYSWQNLESIEKDLEKKPANYTAWFKICFEMFFAFAKTKKASS